MEAVRVVDREGFVLDGKTVEFDEKVERKSFLKESKKTKVFEAYENLITNFIDVLKQYKIVVDRIVPIGDIVNLAEIHTFLLKSFTGSASDKRIASPANRPDSVAYGTALLQQLILSKKAAIDPAFVNTIFWPSPELAEANQAAWATPGLLKITHTRTDVSEAADLDAAAVDALTVELNAFLNTARVDESVHAAVKAEREKLVEEHRRVAANLHAVRAAVEKKLASEVKPESEAKPVEGEVKPVEGGEKPEGEVKPEGEEKPVEGEVKPEGEEAKPESEEKPAPKSDELRELDTEEGELDDILRSIQSDKYMCSGEEHIQSLYQRMKDCDGRLHALAASVPDVVLEEAEKRSCDW